MPGKWSRRGVWTTVAALSVTLTGVLTGCGSSSGGDGPQTIRFVWWGAQDRADATEKAVALFEKKYPDIKVKTEFSGYADYVQKLTTQMAGGAAPDVMQLDRPTFGEYVHRHVLADLGDAGKAIRVNKIPSNLLSGGQVDGAQYAIPAGQTAQVLVYDTALFKKAGVTLPSQGNGWTWEQFTTAMNKVGSATGTPGTTDFGWAVDWFESWLHAQGKQLYTSAGKLAFTKDDLARFWNLTGDMRKAKGVSAPQATTKMDGSMQTSALVLKQAASEMNYDSNLTSYNASYKGTLKAAPLPGAAGSDRTGMAALPPVYYGVAQHSSHKDAAEKLLDFLVNDPAAGKALGATRGLPANTDIRTRVCDAATAGDKAVCDYESSVTDRLGPSATWLWPTGSSAIKTDFQQVYDDVIFGKTSVADAAERVVKDAQDSLDS
ncbi:ABC transporter substrate-binding protein [Streptomyces odontomachi]|uniref:ABC transporter substrate-binding protein n=1 Tax=Streptomyces odontomachi TaxID=2944940 RepID=UPI00210B3D0F|nr:extracellular solute-binding protein [Streptomyces sp. ODS25]